MHCPRQHPFYLQPQGEGGTGVSLRALRVVFSPYLPPQQCYYVIDRAGLRSPTALEVGARSGAAPSLAGASAAASDGQHLTAQADVVAVGVGPWQAGVAQSHASEPMADRESAAAGGPARCPGCCGVGCDACFTASQLQQLCSAEQPSVGALADLARPCPDTAPATSLPGQPSAPEKAGGGAGGGDERAALEAGGAGQSGQESSATTQSRQTEVLYEAFEYSGDQQPCSLATGVFAL